MKLQKVDLEKILMDCRAAHAFLDRIENQIHTLIASREPRIAGNAENSPRGEFQGVHPCPDLSEPEKAQEGANLSVIRDSGGFVQDEMFPEMASKSRSSGHIGNKKTSFFAKKGCPTITRRQALINFINIALGKDLLTLAQVNQIFGYNESTSGTFIKHAVKRGELLMIPSGKVMKFLSSDVRAFIKSYYDSISSVNTKKQG